MEQNLMKLKEDQNRDIKQMKEKFEQQLKIVEHKSEAIEAENFEYAVENVSQFMPINTGIMVVFLI